MNLLDRLKMVGAVICLLSFVACEDPTELGKNLQNIKNIEVRYAEVPLETGMIRVDSINTTNQGYLLVGEVNDPVFGKMTASSFTTLAFKYSTKLEENSVLDSAILVLRITEFNSIGDVTKIGFQVRELVDSLRALEEYSTSSLAISYNDESDLGEVIMPFDSKTSQDTLTIRIKLNDVFGDKLLRFLKEVNGSSEASQINFIKNVTRGLALIPDTDDGLVKINTSSGNSYLRVYYTYNDSLEFYSDFDLNYPLINTKHVKGFTKVSLDRSQALLSYANTYPEYHFFPSGDEKSFNSNITGILPILKFQNIYSFFDTLESVIINKATLIVEEDENTTISKALRPAGMLMYIAEEDSKLDYLSTLQRGNENPTAQTNPTILPYIGENIYYSDITTSIQGIFDKTMNFKNIVLSNTQYSTQRGFYYPNNNLSRLEIKKAKIGIYYTVPIK